MVKIVSFLIIYCTLKCAASAASRYLALYAATCVSLNLLRRCAWKSGRAPLREAFEKLVLVATHTLGWIAAHIAADEGRIDRSETIA